MTTAEQRLFEIVERIGETSTNSFDIIDAIDTVDDVYGEKSFKVYHSNRYCFDVSKINEGTDYNGVWLGYSYSVYDEWEDYEKLDILDYITLFKNEGYE